MDYISKADTAKTPVLFLIFNRKDVSVKAFESIRRYRPDRLYIAADGPRPDRRGEKELCEQTRRAVLDMIDWPCEPRLLFRDTNKGCAEAVNEAISWFFEAEEQGAIIEDDVVVGDDFFYLCEEALPKYADCDRVMMITSQYLSNHPASERRCGFSRYAQIWGWATWRRAWKKMDMTVAPWEKISFSMLLKAFSPFRAAMMYNYWRTAHRLVSSGKKFNSWATRWAISLFAEEGLSLTPYVNLSLNIGCTGVGGAHYEANDKDPYSDFSIGRLDRPLLFPESLTAGKRFAEVENRDFRRIRTIGLKKKLKKLIPLK